MIINVARLSEDPQRLRVWENNQFVLICRTTHALGICRTTHALGILILTSKIDDLRGEAVGGQILDFPTSIYNGLDAAEAMPA